MCITSAKKQLIFSFEGILSLSSGSGHFFFDFVDPAVVDVLMQLHFLGIFVVTNDEYRLKGRVPDLFSSRSELKNLVVDYINLTKLK